MIHLNPETKPPSCSFCGETDVSVMICGPANICNECLHISMDYIFESLKKRAPNNDASEPVMSEAFERIEAMIEDNGSTWDLSINDKDALKKLLTAARSDKSDDVDLREALSEMVRSAIWVSEIGHSGCNKVEIPMIVWKEFTDVYLNQHKGNCDE